MPHLFWGEGGVELGDRVWYPMKAHHNGHNLSSETHTLPRFVFEQYALHFGGWGTGSPYLGDGVELGEQTWSHSNLYYWFPISSP